MSYTLNTLYSVGLTDGTKKYFFTPIHSITLKSNNLYSASSLVLSNVSQKIIVITLPNQFEVAQSYGIPFPQPYYNSMISFPRLTFYTDSVVKYFLFGLIDHDTLLSLLTESNNIFDYPPFFEQVILFENFFDYYSISLLDFGIKYTQDMTNYDIAVIVQPESGKINMLSFYAEELFTPIQSSVINLTF